MIEMYLLIALALFLLGATGGCIVVISLASHRDHDITTPAASRLARGARTATRLHTRGLGVHHQVAYRHDRGRMVDREW
jgi:hypothetical protein